MTEIDLAPNKEQSQIKERENEENWKKSIREQLQDEGLSSKDIQRVMKKCFPSEIKDSAKIQQYVKKVAEEIDVPGDDFIGKVSERMGNYIISREGEEKETRAVFTSGLLDDDTFFQTIFIQQNGKHIPKVVTSKNEVLDVQDNYSESLRAGVPKEELTEEDRYSFFTWKGIRHKFRVDELFFKDTLQISTVNNDVLRLMGEGKSSSGIYDELKGKIQEYWDHHNELEYDVQVVNCIETNLLRVFNKTFYLILQGKEDTGKSTLQKLLSMLQFNGLFAGKGTVAFNVRLIHFLGVNVNQDEFEKMSKEEKKVFIGVANTGLYGNGTYNIVDVNKRKLKDQMTVLFTFSKKTFSTNSLGGFDKSFLSRCYQLVTVRQGRNLKDIHDLTRQDEQEFQDLRNRAFVYCLHHWKEIKEAVLSVKEELQAEGTFGRKTDMTSLILGILKHFKGDYYVKVRDHLLEKEGLQEAERSTTNEALTFEYLVKRLVGDETIIEVSNQEIADYISEERNLSEEDRKGLCNTIGWIFRNFELLRRKDHYKRGARGQRMYRVEKTILLDVLRRFQFTDLLQKVNQEPAFRNVKNVRNVKSTDNSDNSDVSEGGFPKDNIQVEEVNDDPKFTELDKDYSGKCSYCGRSYSWIRFKDQDGHHICEKCMKQESDESDESE